MAEIEFIEIPDFTFTDFYYPDFLRSLTIYNRQNVPEITDESDEEPFTQMTRAFALVGHLNNVLLDVVAVETLLPTARLLESVRSHLRLIDVVLDQAKPSTTDVILELSAIFTTPTTFVPQGTQVATKETNDSPQITFEANEDNIINPTNVFDGVFSFDPAYIEFLSNTFHTGDKITIEGVDFTPNIEFSVGSSIQETVDNFVRAVNTSTNIDIEDNLFAYRTGNRAVIVFINDELVTIDVTTTDNILEVTLVDETLGGVDASLSTDTEKRADDFTSTVDRTIKNVTYSLKKTGTVTGNVKCSIETDNGGKPSGTVVATATSLIDITTLTTSYVSYQFDFDETAQVIGGDKYWYVLEYDSPIDVSAPAAEVTEIEFTTGAIPAVAEISDVKINNLPAFYDIVGAAKHWLLDAQNGSGYYVWYNVADSTDKQTDGLIELSEFDFVGQNGASHDVIGAANYITFRSGGDAISYYIWFNVTDGVNIQTDPLVGGTGIQVDILLADADTIIATKTADEIDIYADFISTSSLSVTSIGTVDSGVTTDPVDGGTGTTITVTQHGTNELVAGRTGIQVDILSTDGILQIAQKTIALLDVITGLDAILLGSDTVRVTQTVVGSVTDPLDVNAGITIVIDTVGDDLTNAYDVNGTALSWLLDAQNSQSFNVWYNVTDGNSTQSDPLLSGKFSTQVDILKNDTQIEIATKTSLVLTALSNFTATSSGTITTITQAIVGFTNDAVDIDALVTVTVTTQGGDDSRVTLDGSGIGSSQHFTNLWSTTVTTLVMKIVANATNFNSRAGGFGINRSGEASTDGAVFPLNALDTVAGSMFYCMHSTVMWNAIKFTLDTVGVGITGVWEYYDGNIEDTIPDNVENLGQTLEIDLTNLLGTLDRTGAIVTVTYTGTGASETLPVIHDGDKNIIITNTLLSQISVSTDENLYIVGANWNELPQIDDTTQDFTQNGKLVFDLPQDKTNNWDKKTINTITGYPIRYRVVSVEDVVQQPVIDLADITENKQFLLFEATQGESKTEDPLGSSDGSSNQVFKLGFTPLIVTSLQIEVNEGTGFTQWNRKDNFLTSTQISKDYTLEVTADDIATITFGDGKNGKKPAAGVDNIRAIYRIFGGGSANNGNVGSNTINVNKSGIAFVSKVFNPRSATGFRVKEGSTEADLARLKIAGPASLRVRNRGITPDDFEFLATEYTTDLGVALVTRALTIEESFGIKTIELVVVGTGGSLLTGIQLDDLDHYFNGSKPDNIKGVGLSNHEVTSKNYIPRVIDVTAEVTGGNKAEIENAIKALLNPEAKFNDGVTFRWDFNDTVPVAILNSEIINVDASEIKNVKITSPAADIILQPRELPLAGTLNIQIV